MVNNEVLGGLVSALSRGESLHKAMFSLFNAGYKKEEIEEAAMFLKSQIPVDPKNKKEVKPEPLKKMDIKPSEDIKLEQKQEQKPEQRPLQAIQKVEAKSNPVIKKNEVKQVVSKYESPEEFRKIIDDAIKNLTDMKSPVKVIRPDSEFKPPILIQRVSEYSSKKVSKFAIVILFFLLAMLLGGLVALFIFKDRVIEIFNNLSF